MTIYTILQYLQYILRSISKFSSFSRPHCTAALLSLLLAHTPHISCRSHRPEEWSHILPKLIVS